MSDRSAEDDSKYVEQTFECPGTYTASRCGGEHRTDGADRLLGGISARSHVWAAVPSLLLPRLLQQLPLPQGQRGRLRRHHVPSVQVQVRHRSSVACQSRQCPALQQVRALRDQVLCGAQSEHQMVSRRWLQLRRALPWQRT
jgi:hypothetical protein